MAIIHYAIQTSDGYASIEYFDDARCAELLYENDPQCYGNDGEGSFECDNFSEHVTTLAELKRERGWEEYKDVLCPKCKVSHVQFHTDGGWHCWGCDSKGEESEVSLNVEAE